MIHTSGERRVDTGAWHRFDLAAWAIVTAAALAVSYSYSQNIDLPNGAARLATHDQIIAGTAFAPYRYRVLVPFATEGVRNLAPSFVNAHRAFQGAYAAYDFAAVMFSLGTLFALVRSCFGTRTGLVAALLMAGVMPVCFADHHYQPWSLIEPGFVALALCLARAGRDGAFVALTAIATLNRETGVLIPVLYALTRSECIPGRKLARQSILLRGAGMLGLSLAIFVGLRALLGGAEGLASVAALWTRNTQLRSLVHAAFNVALFLGPVWLLLPFGWRRAPALFRRAALAIPIYLAPVAVFGVWHEVRLLMSLYPILIPIALSALEPEPTREGGLTPTTLAAR